MFEQFVTWYSIDNTEINNAVSAYGDHLPLISSDFVASLFYAVQTGLKRVVVVVVALALHGLTANHPIDIHQHCLV